MCSCRRNPYSSSAGGDGGGGDLFAIANLVAAVGLWLATPWGGALWLFAASAQIFIAIAIRNSISMVWVGIDVALILVYFVLTFNAGRSSGQYAD